MRSLKKLALTAALSVAVGGPAVAQQTPATGTVTTTSAGTTSTTTTASGGSLSGIGGGTGSATALGDSSLATPAINAQVGAGATPSSISASNVFGGSYNNPYFQGTTTNLKGTPGGFGTALYGAGGGTATPNATGNTINARSGNAAVTTGGRTQGGGQQLGGQQAGGANANQSGIVIALPRQISYTATLSFKAPVATMPQVATDLRATLDRSTMLGDPRGVSLAMDGGVVVLSGRVATDDELRLVEGMVRLTPGVRDVRNELKVGPVTP